MEPDPRSGDPLIDDLPLAYAVALRLRGAGASDADIARALGVDVAAVPTLLSIGARKLDELRRHRQQR